MKFLVALIIADTTLWPVVRSSGFICQVLAASCQPSKQSATTHAIWTTKTNRAADLSPFSAASLPPFSIALSSSLVSVLPNSSIPSAKSLRRGTFLSACASLPIRVADFSLSCSLATLAILLPVWISLEALLLTTLDLLIIFFPAVLSSLEPFLPKATLATRLFPKANVPFLPCNAPLTIFLPICSLNVFWAFDVCDFIEDLSIVPSITLPFSSR